MKFTIEKNTLIKLLSSVCDVASKKNPNNPAILQNIKIESKNDHIYLTGTDSDTYVKDDCKTFVDSDGSTTVPAQLMYDIIKKMNDGAEIVCEYIPDNNTLNISSGRSKFKLMCLDADGYPNFEEHQMQIEFNIKANDLVTIIDKTRFSISDDPSRYYLNGLFLQTVDEDGLKLNAVSTDGHKLSVITLGYYEGTCEVGGIIIPKKALPEIKKIAVRSNNSDLKISASKTKIKIKTEDTVIISKLIDAEFPDYRRVIPKDNDKILKINKRDISSIIDRISTVANDNHKGIKLVLTENNLYLESNSAENGFASEEIKVDFDYKDKIEIGFNSRFMLEIISQIESDMVEIKLKDGNSAIIIKGSEESNNTFVLMPIRI